MFLREKNRLELQYIIHNKTKTRYVFGVTIQEGNVSLFSFPFHTFIHPSIFVYIYIFLSPCWHEHRRPPLGSQPALPTLRLSGTPTFSLLLSSSSHFARVRGARQSVQPSGLKVNAYVIANCLQSLGAALKKDMLRRQLRPLAFASLSDRICFKGLVRIIFNPRALCAPWTAGGGKIAATQFMHGMKNA